MFFDSLISGKTEALFFQKLTLEKPNAVVFLFSGDIKVRRKTLLRENWKTELQESCFLRHRNWLYLIRTQTLGNERAGSLESELFRQSGGHFLKSSARPQTTWAVLRYHLGHGMCSQKKIRAVKRNLKYHICTKIYV